MQDKLNSGLVEINTNFQNTLKKRLLVSIYHLSSLPVNNPYTVPFLVQEYKWEVLKWL